MRLSIIKGSTFGVTSGIITTLGLIIGLDSGTHSKLVVLGGIITIAVADSFSDALGMHISEESENHHTTREIWTATLSTFFSKFLFAMLFAVPVLLFQLSTAIIISVVMGLGLIGILSYFIAKMQNAKPLRVIAEHLFIAIVVIILTYFIGEWIGNNFI
jgi:VIT1/CCC1 family predicted Fe2+/Mn2+ transporter